MCTRTFEISLKPQATGHKCEQWNTVAQVFSVSQQHATLTYSEYDEYYVNGHSWLACNDRMLAVSECLSVDSDAVRCNDDSQPHLPVASGVTLLKRASGMVYKAGCSCQGGTMKINTCTDPRNGRPDCLFLVSCAPYKVCFHTITAARAPGALISRAGPGTFANWCALLPQLERCWVVQQPGAHRIN